MEQLIVMIVRVDDEKPENLTEIWQRQLPQISLEKLEAERYLDKIENIVSDVGSDLLRRLFVERWLLTDKAFGDRHYEEHAREEGVLHDGFDSVESFESFWRGKFASPSSKKPKK